MARTPFTSVDELLTALGSLADQPSDDVVAALPHLLQTADLLAANDSGDPELVAAGLVHDLASALDLGCPDHAGAGATLVGPLLGARVARLVAGHTDAKRYLVTVEPAYATGLSENSTLTLVDQGGPMGAAELAAFEAGPDPAALVALRRADDRAKEPERPTSSVASWRPLLDQVVSDARSA